MKTIETGPKIETLGISDETLAAIILEAKSFDAVLPQSDPDESSNDSDDRQISALEIQDDNPARQMLEQSVNGLTDAQKNTLVALTWLGRGDYDVAEWEDAVRKARSRGGGATSYYLSGIPLLGDYLDEGASLLGFSVTEAKAKLMSDDQNPDPARAVN